MRKFVSISLYWLSLVILHSYTHSSQLPNDYENSLVAVPAFDLPGFAYLVVSEEKAAALFARFAANGTWQAPTLVVPRMAAFLNDSNLTNDPRLKYVRRDLRDSCIDLLGTVEEGKKADLVLLEANPLENITNTKRISAVIVGGRLFPKIALDKMLKEVERAANKG